MSDGQYSQEAPPDPMALFRLPNEVQAGSNVFAFQKAFGTVPGEAAGSWAGVGVVGRCGLDAVEGFVVCATHGYVGWLTLDLILH